MKKLLFLAILCLFPFQAQAACDISKKNVKAISQQIINKNYAQNSFRMKKPSLIVSNKKVEGYDAEELGGTITIYAKSLDDLYCDQYFDGLTPYLTEIVNHEYVHAMDEELGLSKKIGEKKMSENTAYIGEHVLKNTLWPESFVSRELKPNETKKYATLQNIFQAKSRLQVAKTKKQTSFTHKK